MYYDCRDDIRRDLDTEKREAIHLQRRLREIGDLKGTLICKLHGPNKRKEHYIQFYENGRRIQHYITREEVDELERYKEKRAIELALDRCSDNIETLTSLLMAYKGISPDEIDEALPLAYRDSENYRRMIQNQVGARSWLRKKRVEKEQYPLYRPENLANSAADETPTRSKSEALIIEVLHTLDIPFIYELPIKLVTGEDSFGSPIYTLRTPDFTCLNKRTGAEFIVEHVGLTNDSAYMDYTESKLRLYIANGYIPYINLLMTYDDRNGKINVPSIYKLFETYLK